MLENILKKKAFIKSLLFFVFMGGIISYMNIGKLEDPEIAVKSAVIITQYPGADAHEVELEVTDIIEKAVQKLENVKEIKSRSLPGLSEITVRIETFVKTEDLPQLWDHLRRKVNDVSSKLPAEAHSPIVNDDYGDVYGIFVAVSSDGYTYEELDKYTEYLKKEYLTVDGIKRIEVYGKKVESIDINFSSEKFASLGINPMYIVKSLRSQLSVSNSGDIVCGTERIKITPGHKISSIEEIGNLLIAAPGQQGSFRLKDIAEVKRSYMKPILNSMNFNSKQALGLAISMEKGVNVIQIGKEFDKKTEELNKDIPAGIHIDKIFFQPDRVSSAIDNFVINLAQSVFIVIVVLLFAMGLRSGMLISSGLVFTILGTIIVMFGFGIELHRISLAAIIVAMGMLVDNSIVVADGILIDLKKGKDRRKAFVDTAKKTAVPLLGATAIAILAFLPLSLSPNGAGEFLSSLFTVLAISLGLSWVFAMVQTPFNARFFFWKDVKKRDFKNANPYDSSFYRSFEKIVKSFLHHKTVVMLVTTVILIVSLYCFRYVKVLFMPNLDYNQFMVEYYLPKGSNIDQVSKDLEEIQAEILSWEGVNDVIISVGATPARYTLVRPMNSFNSNYGELILNVKDYNTAQKTTKKIDSYLEQYYPQARSRSRMYNPMFSEYSIEASFSGPDPKILRDLSSKAEQIMRDEETAIRVTNSWDNRGKELSMVYSTEKGPKVSINRSDMASSIAIATNGLPIGLYHEGDKSLPILLKLENSVSNDINKLYNTPVWGARESSIPLSQLIDSSKIVHKDMVIKRIDGSRTIIAQCDPATGYSAPAVWNKLKKKIEDIEIPRGYTFEWKGEHKSSNEANESLFKYFPLAIGLMIIIVIALFNNFKQPIIVFSVVPLAFIGVIAGFLITRQYFNFVGIIGALGLIGMMIKNVIVLLDEINFQLEEGKTRFNAVIDSTISRVRPVMMASGTTILGMFPLLTDVMFQSMAITIMFGLFVGSIITLLIVPVLYSILYNVNAKEE